MGAERRHWALAALGFALLLICARWQLGDFASFAAAQDLDFFDESQYLSVGAHAASLWHLNAQWAPPYCIWYRLLQRLTGDTVVTYHLNAYLLAIALPALWYLACLSLRVRSWWALATALAWLISSANLETLRVGNFAACIVLGALVIASFVRAATWSWWIAIAGMWLAAFVRPELIVAASLTLAIGAWTLARTSRRDAALWTVAALLPLIALGVAFGLPVGGGRSGAAFQQHLAGNILEWHGLAFSNWIHYEDVIRRYYALPASAFDFLRHEPLAFLHHVVTNLLRLVTESVGAALRPVPALMDASHGIALALLGLALLGGAVGTRARLGLTIWSGVLGACGALVLISCAVIYPRAHYLPLLLGGLLLFIAPRRTDESSATRELAAIGVILAVFAVIPRYSAVHAELPRPQETTVLALRGLDLPNVRLFDDAGILQVYLKVPATRLGPRDFQPPFDDFLRSRDVNVVVISPQLGLDPLLAPDAAWQRFQREPGEFGFACASIARTDRTLCVRKAP